MSCVYILIGKVASGKTHYANKLAKENGVVPLSNDDLILTMFDSCLGDKHDEITSRASLYLFGVAKKLYEMGISSSLDFGFWSKESRISAKEFFEKNNIKTKTMYFNPDDSVRKQRLMARNKSLLNSPKREYIIEGELLERLDGKFIEPDRAEYDEIISD